MTPCPLTCKFGCEYDEKELDQRAEGCPYQSQMRGFKVVCELPVGTRVKALNGVLVACHPNHAPIYIGGTP